MLTPHDLFDWWTISMGSPQDAPKQQLARLLKDRLHGTEVALTAMRQSTAARDNWASLRAHTKPSLDVAIDFWFEALKEFRLIR